MTVFPVHTPEDATLDVAFVQGLGGDAQNSWSRDRSSLCWLRWLAIDIDGLAVVLGLGVVAIVIAIVTKVVVAALPLAYDILVGGLLVAILGGLVGKRGTGYAAAASMAVGSVITLGTMIILEINAEVPLDGIYANEPIC